MLLTHFGDMFSGSTCSKPDMSRWLVSPPLPLVVVVSDATGVLPFWFKRLGLAHRLTRGSCGLCGLRPGIQSLLVCARGIFVAPLLASTAMAGVTKFTGFEGKDGGQTPIPVDPASKKFSLAVSNTLVDAGEAFEVDSAWIEAVAKKLGEKAENVPLKIFLTLTATEFAGIVDGLEVPDAEATKFEKTFPLPATSAAVVLRRLESPLRAGTDRSYSNGGGGG